MTVTCPTITVTAPPVGANITATDIKPSATSCQAPCSLTVDVTWTNQGDIGGTYTPGLSVDNGTPSTFPPETLNPGASVTHTFSITNLSQGGHILCPVPN